MEEKITPTPKSFWIFHCSLCIPMPRNTGSSVHVTICFLYLCMQWDKIAERDFFIIYFINLQFQTFYFLFSYYIRPSFRIFLSIHSSNLKFRANPPAVRAMKVKRTEGFFNNINNFLEIRPVFTCNCYESLINISWKTEIVHRWREIWLLL